MGRRGCRVWEREGVRGQAQGLPLPEIWEGDGAGVVYGSVRGM